MSEFVYTVAGMTCSHCANAVTEEISSLDGVRGVAVDVDTGRVTVNSDRPLPIDRVRAAIAEAGYQLITG